MHESNKIKRGVDLEQQIESLAYGGMGLARKDNFVIFVKGGTPGQKVNARIYKKKKGRRPDVCWRAGKAEHTSDDLLYKDTNEQWEEEEGN